jgi:hypothetical protein
MTDREFTISVPRSLAAELIALVGGERPTTQSQWSFPDDSTFWETDEALRYALEVMPSILEVGA